MLWQAIALVGVLVPDRRSSCATPRSNMVKAGIASGFDFLWRTAGIEVPFVLTDYTPSDTILALLWVGIVNTLLVTRRRRSSAGDGARLRRRHRAAVAQLAAVDARRRLHRVRPQHPAAVLRAVLVLRRDRRPARRRATVDRHFRRRVPQQSRPDDPAAERRRAAFGWPLLAILGRCSSSQIGFARWARRRAGAHRPGLRRCWMVGARAVGCCRRGARRRGARRRAGTCRRCAASTIAAASCWCRNSSRCSRRSSTYTAGFIAEIVRGGIQAVPPGPDRGGARARPAPGRIAAPRRHPAGAARDDPADDQPVPQRAQELVASAPPSPTPRWSACSWARR